MTNHDARDPSPLLFTEYLDGCRLAVALAAGLRAVRDRLRFACGALHRLWPQLTARERELLDDPDDVEAKVGETAGLSTSLNQLARGRGERQ
jgi:hypothetical protein